MLLQWPSQCAVVFCVYSVLYLSSFRVHSHSHVAAVWPFFALHLRSCQMRRVPHRSLAWAWRSLPLFVLLSRLYVEQKFSRHACEIMDVCSYAQSPIVECDCSFLMVNINVRRIIVYFFVRLVYTSVYLAIPAKCRFHHLRLLQNILMSSDQPMA